MSFADQLRQRFDGQRSEIGEHAGQITMTVPMTAWVEVARALRDEPALRFEQAVDLCGVSTLMTLSERNSEKLAGATLSCPAP